MKFDEKILKQIKEILESLKGKDKAITSKKIAEMVNIDPGPSSITIRSYITEAIRRYQLPVAAAGGSKGYYFITNAQEFKDYMKILQNRLINTYKRSIMVTKIYQKYYRDEELELTGEIISFEDDEEEE